jgi:hypothetical protein
MLPAQEYSTSQQPELKAKARAGQGQGSKRADQPEH